MKDEFKTSIDVEKSYRSDVYEAFKNDKGGRYDTEKVNARYPEPKYLK